MHPFEETISIVGPIVLAIIVLTVFFKFMRWLGSLSATSPHRLAVKGVFDDNTRATVHLSNRTTLEDVRIIGFTDSQSAKGAFPWELHGMVGPGRPGRPADEGPSEADPHDRDSARPSVIGDSPSA